MHPVTRQAVTELATRWEQIAPGSPVSILVWLDLLTKFHPQVIQQKLNHIAANRVEFSFVGYFKKTMIENENNVFLLQTQMGLEPVFVLDDEEVVPRLGWSVVKIVRKQVRSKSRPRVMFLVRVGRAKLGKEPLPPRRVSGEIRKLAREHQARVHKGEFQMTGAVADALIERLIAE